MRDYLRLEGGEIDAVAKREIGFELRNPVLQVLAEVHHVAPLDHGNREDQGWLVVVQRAGGTRLDIGAPDGEYVGQRDRLAGLRQQDRGFLDVVDAGEVAGRFQRDHNLAGDDLAARQDYVLALQCLQYVA